jgi:hypothetical protein
LDGNRNLEVAIFAVGLHCRAAPLSRPARLARGEYAGSAARMGEVRKVPPAVAAGMKFVGDIRHQRKYGAARQRRPTGILILRFREFFLEIHDLFDLNLGKLKVHG